MDEKIIDYLNKTLIILIIFLISSKFLMIALYQFVNLRKLLEYSSSNYLWIIFGYVIVLILILGIIYSFVILMKIISKKELLGYVITIILALIFTFLHVSWFFSFNYFEPYLLWLFFLIMNIFGLLSCLALLAISLILEKHLIFKTTK